MVVLRTRGCEFAKRTGGCTVCGFLNHADDEVDDDAIVAQLESSLTELELTGVEELDLLTLGSFLNDNEVSPTLRQRLLERVARELRLRRVSFESRAEYVHLDELQRCKSLLGDRHVELGIGLESADDRVRNELVRKALSRRAFLDVIDLVARAGLDLLVYLLVKPPGLDERAAIDDAVASAEYVFRAARERGVRARVAFEPIFICENTELETLYTASKYRLVNLWSVVEVIRRSHGQGEVFIGLSDEDLSQRRLPQSCELCRDDIVAAVERYNATQSLDVFADLDCECRAEYLAALRREK